MAESAASQAPLNLLLKLALWYQQVCLPCSKSLRVAPLITFALSPHSSWLGGQQEVRGASVCVHVHESVCPLGASRD